MKTDAKSSGSDSGKTSPNTPASEAELLQREAERARAAIGEAFSDLGRSLKATADPHVLTRDHPWIAISTAAVAGFAAAVTLIPSKEQQALRALAELERARHTPPPSPDATSDKSAAAAGGVLATVAAEVVKLARPLLTALLTAGISRVTAGNANGAGAAGGNGHTGDKEGDEEIATPS